MDRFFDSILRRPDEGWTVWTGQWGRVVRFNDRLELHIEQLPSNGQISIPRMSSPIGEIRLPPPLNDTKIRFRPGINNWTFTVPPAPESARDLGRRNHSAGDRA